MGVIEKKLANMGLTLPPTYPYSSPNRTGCVQVGNILFLSGHGSGRHDMALAVKRHGKVGTEVTEEEAYQTARAVALSMLASIKAHLGDLDRVKRVVRLLGMVNSATGFERQFAVIDGASDLFYELWGPEYGRHARAAVGIAELGRHGILEIMGEFELHPGSRRKPKAKPRRRGTRRSR
ncbi:MAG: RidA family protein [Deltaproteobacteria bacterium]|nr:RidA family protein [Deltaproteobacteria bacterium]